ncbi:hypothetical protein PROFUN_05655 [Planoprotostelium fungivorum]|uniref:START domain-containing protein n=1 Tax=Planoprotostelium fungivorum TaxID=1890364 RepID=A0A2P6MUJ1_9EUKA|nr:hypothetical protein PROFUN_05655 [Planoprotostelium fungivorum]
MVKPYSLTSSSSQYSEDSFTMESIVEHQFKPLEDIWDRQDHPSDEETEAFSQRLYSRFSTSNERAVPLISWLVLREIEGGFDFRKTSLSSRTIFYLLHSKLTIRFLQMVISTFQEMKQVTEDPLARSSSFLDVLLSSIEDVPVVGTRIEATEGIPFAAVYFFEQIIFPFLSSQDEKSTGSSPTRGIVHCLQQVFGGETAHLNNYQLRDKMHDWFVQVIDEIEITKYEKLIACSSVVLAKKSTEEDQKFLEWINQLRGPVSEPEDAEREYMRQQLLEKINCKTWKVMVEKESERFQFYSRKEPGIPSTAAKIQTRIYLPLREAVQQWSTRMWSPEDDDMIKYYKLEPQDNGDIHAIVNFKLPPPFQNRLWSWYVSEKWTSHRVVRMGWNAPHPPVKGCVVGHVYLEGEVYEEVEEGVTDVTMILHATTKGNIPAWVENISLGKQATKFRKLTKKINRTGATRSPSKRSTSSSSVSEIAERKERDCQNRAKCVDETPWAKFTQELTSSN